MPLKPLGFRAFFCVCLQNLSACFADKSAQPAVFLPSTLICLQNLSAWAQWYSITWYSGMKKAALRHYGRATDSAKILGKRLTMRMNIIIIFIDIYSHSLFSGRRCFHERCGVLWVSYGTACGSHVGRAKTRQPRFFQEKQFWGFWCAFCVLPDLFWLQRHFLLLLGGGREMRADPVL